MGKPGIGSDILVSKGLQTSGLVVFRTNKGLIYWDLTLTSHDAKAAVAIIDAKAMSHGFIDMKSGERMPFPPEFSYKKQRGEYEVDTIFKEPGVSFLIMPGVDPQEELNQFDKPEELETYTDPLVKWPLIVAKKDQHYREIRRNVALQILAERSINYEQVADLSIEDIMDIRHEIEERIKQLEQNPEV